MSFPELEGLVTFGEVPAEPGGIDLGGSVRLGPAQRRTVGRVTFHRHRIFRGEVEIGTVDYDACHECEVVVLGEIGLVDAEHRQGIGSRVLACCRDEVPGYRWFITLEKRASRPFWERIRATYPSEYINGQHCPCPAAAGRAGEGGHCR